MGIPVITCKCAVCLSDNPKNKRLRPSALLSIGEKRFLFDAGPDLRYQLLRYGIEDLDALLLTHVHFDHIAGLDDLRVFYFFRKKKIPCLLSQNSLQFIEEKYPHLDYFQYTLCEGDFGKVSFGGLDWECLSFSQNGAKVTGFRLGKFAYVLDIKKYTEQVFEALKGVETLVLSGLRPMPSPSHLSLPQATAFAQKVGAKMTWISHIAHELDHDEANASLPSMIQLAYDGLEVEIF